MPCHHKQWEDKAGDILGVVEVGLNTQPLMAGVALTPNHLWQHPSTFIKRLTPQPLLKLNPTTYSSGSEDKMGSNHKQLKD